MTGSNPQGNSGIFPATGSAIADAAELLCAGGIVAVPTETVYGLAADASNADAVAEIYRAKGRPEFNPLIVHVPGIEAARGLANFDARAEMIANEYWPGPLTLVLSLQEDAPVAAAVTAGLPTIAIRCPSHPVMQNLLAATGLCLAAPSANRSGGISPTTAQHVQHSFGEAAPMILDGESCKAGLESTIIALRKDGWQLLRPGPISTETLQALIGEPPEPVRAGKIEAPGQLATHYAPSKPLRLEAREAKPDEWHIGFGAVAGDENLSADSDLAEAASRLFAALHAADASTKVRIAVAPIPANGIGIAIHDRLKRAAVG